jgi:predicted N-acetyltransferase YhbS
MTICKFSITPEKPEHKADIESLLDKVFGLSRRVKTSYRLREGETPVEGLSYVALEPGRGVVGAISFWRIFIGEDGFQALLLGPLAVAPDRQGAGIGRALMKLGLERAAMLTAKLVILVGDEPYYGRVGFRKVPEGQLILPGPVDPNRLLHLEMEEGALARAKGLVLPPHRFKQRLGALATLTEPGEAGQG